MMIKMIISFIYVRTYYVCLQKSFVIPKAEKRKAEEAPPKPPPPPKQPKTEPQASFQRQFLEAVGGSGGGGEVGKR